MNTQRIKITDIFGYVLAKEMSLKFIEQIFKDAFYSNKYDDIKENNSDISVVLDIIKTIDFLTEYQNKAVKELLIEEKKVGFILENKSKVIAVVAYIMI